MPTNSLPLERSFTLTYTACALANHRLCRPAESLRQSAEVHSPVHSATASEGHAWDPKPSASTSSNAEQSDPTGFGGPDDALSVHEEQRGDHDDVLPAAAGGPPAADRAAQEAVRGAVGQKAAAIGPANASSSRASSGQYEG